MPLRTDGFEPVLAALSERAQEYFGDARAEVEPVARLERPFSALLRLRVKSAGRDSHAHARPTAAISRPSRMKKNDAEVVQKLDRGNQWAHGAA